MVKGFPNFPRVGDIGKVRETLHHAAPSPICTECEAPLTALDLEDGATEHAGCAGVRLEAQRWAEGTPHDRITERLLRREPCPHCGRLMGASEQRHGACLHCVRIHAAETAAREDTR